MSIEILVIIVIILKIINSNYQHYFVSRLRFFFKISILHLFLFTQFPRLIISIMRYIQIKIKLKEVEVEIEVKL